MVSSAMGNPNVITIKRIERLTPKAITQSLLEGEERRREEEEEEEEEEEDLI